MATARVRVTPGIPLGWLAYEHNGSGGFVVRSSLGMNWEDVSATGILCARSIYTQKYDKIHRISCIFKGEWVWRYRAANGQMRFDRTWDEAKPTHDLRGNLIPANMLKQGVEISDVDWAKLYPTKTHDPGDVLVSVWKIV